MWKSRPEEKTASSNFASSNPPTQPALTPPTPPFSSPSREPQTSQPFRPDVAAHIGKSVLIKGELSGSEDLYLDGEVEGAIHLNNHTLLVGPNGRIRANISAREIVIHGRVEGNITGAERVELKKSCVLTGDIRTQRIVIEDGAFFKGLVDLQRESKAEPPLKAMAASSGAGLATVTVLEPAEAVLEHT